MATTTIFYQLVCVWCAIAVVQSYQSYNPYPQNANYRSEYKSDYRSAAAVAVVDEQQEFDVTGSEMSERQPILQTDLEQMPANRNNHYGIMRQHEKQQLQKQILVEPQMHLYENQLNNMRMAKFNRETASQQQLLSHNNARLQMRQKKVDGTVKSDARQNKCQIWVPSETMEKYKWYSRIQVDQTKRLELIEICCSGYAPVQRAGITTCQPVCNNCRNGFCIEPNVCQCYAEFVPNDNGDCVFSCPLGCQNGRCFLDGSCQCDAGYKLDETRKFCRPICSSGCAINPKHNCTAPEVCGCAKGFQLTDEGCQPICTPDCGPGGECNEENVCECKEGYNLKDGVCQANCYQKCDNGICYSNNRCICNEGFTYHERSTLCVPK